MPTPPPESDPPSPPSTTEDSDTDILMGNSITGLLEGVTQRSTWNSHKTTWEPPDVEELKRLFPAYQIECPLGRGGMGIVYKARDTVLRKTVAIKLLPPVLAADAQLMARFKREAQIMNSLDHPGIVKVYSFVQTPDGHAYFVMDYVEGKTIHELVQAKEISVRKTLRLIVQVCKALHYLHGKGILHRDIKPSNIIVDQAGDARLLDFGIAGQVEKGAENLTLTGHNPGTPFYMAPELHKGDPPTTSSDIYALGVTFYEMLTGERPHIQAPPPSTRSKADSSVDKVVFRALKTKPEARYQDADQMRRDIQRCSRASREFRQAIVIATSIIAIAAITMVWLLRSTDNGKTPAPPHVAEDMFDPLPAQPQEKRSEPTSQPAPERQEDATVLKPAAPSANPGQLARTQPDISTKSLPYTTSFESPEFNAGAFGTGKALETQSSRWSLHAEGNGVDHPQLARIQTAVAKSGKQALLIQAEYAKAVKAGVSATFENSATILNIEADIRLASSPTQSVWQFAAGDESVPGGFVGGINIAPDNGRFQLITPGYGQTAIVMKRDTWYRLRLSFDLSKQSYQVFVNDSVVASDVPFLVRTEKLRVFQFDNFSKGDDLAYLDNFSITEGTVRNITSTNPTTPPTALDSFRTILQGYGWSYEDSRYPGSNEQPPSPMFFHPNGKFHEKWKWNYWIAEPGLIHVQFWEPVYKPETAMALKFNDARTAYAGSFKDSKGKVHKITGTRLDPVK